MLRGKEHQLPIPLRQWLTGQLVEHHGVDLEGQTRVAEFAKAFAWHQHDS